MIYNESEEMYLETILILKQKKDFVRSIDIVEELGYAKSSVSFAINKMAKEGLITIVSNGGIDFTEHGKARAEGVYEKHQVLTELFVSLGVEKSSAEKNACRMEHIITEDVFQAIKNYLKK